MAGEHEEFLRALTRERFGPIPKPRVLEDTEEIQEARLDALRREVKEAR